ncbi:MAG TPA: zinc-ribbon domain containing protein [Candidatus Rubrimentiphilum sp.]|nr:zinc-ribbon domain containing protein [Candidatus Rubrimentiphilum sp.]
MEARFPTMEDKNITCKDCGRDFVFSVRDQQFYAEKGFQNEPQRCRDCRQSRKGQGSGTGGGNRQSFEAVCAECGANTTVPFKPRGDRPVYCRTCYASHAPAASL